MDESAVRGVGQLACPAVPTRLVAAARQLVEGLHPARQVVEVLAVALPFESFIERLAGAALGQRLADAQPGTGRMVLVCLAVRAAQPAAAGIVGAEMSQYRVHLLDRASGERSESLAGAGLGQALEVAGGERVGPQVARRRGVALQPAAPGETLHEPGRGGVVGGRHSASHRRPGRSGA